MKKKNAGIYAIVDRVYDNDWTPYYRWADSKERDFHRHGKYKTEEDAIADIPANIKKILVQYAGVNRTIVR